MDEKKNPVPLFQIPSLPSNDREAEEAININWS